MDMNFQRNKKNILTRVGHSPFTFHRSLSSVYCLFALVLPLSLNVATALMCLALVITLFAVPLPSTVRPPSTVLMLIFFLLHLIALTYTSNVQAGASELLLKSPLLIFPLVMYLSPPSKTTLRRVLMCFVIACVLTSLVCFVRSLINYYNIGAVSWISYTWLSSQMGFLPAYLSLYMAFSFFIVLNNWVKDWQSSRIWQKIVSFFILFFCGYMIVMLGARLVSVTFFILLVGTFLLWMYRRKMLLKGIFVVSIFALGVWKLMDSFFVTRTRMNKIIGKQLKDYDHSFFVNINDPRGQIWESCLAAIERMPMWGYGIGDEVERILLKVYDLKNYHNLLIVNTDAHNQYMQTFLSLGYLGLVCLVAMLLVPLYWTWKTKKYLYLLFLLLISIPMLTECMLETAHGIMYFSFFNSLLCSSYLLGYHPQFKDSPANQAV